MSGCLLDVPAFLSLSRHIPSSSSPSSSSSSEGYNNSVEPTNVRHCFPSLFSFVTLLHLMLFTPVFIPDKQLINICKPTQECDGVVVTSKRPLHRTSNNLLFSTFTWRFLFFCMKCVCRGGENINRNARIINIKYCQDIIRRIININYCQDIIPVNSNHHIAVRLSVLAYTYYLILLWDESASVHLYFIRFLLRSKNRF